ncbi:hypothetical protein ISS08_01955 [Candidatus Pacearchaeota archaeon]|nr:hypothetical protein [Candidatus Pacearchaeota archaeon]
MEVIYFREESDEVIGGMLMEDNSYFFIPSKDLIICNSSGYAGGELLVLTDRECLDRAESAISNNDAVKFDFNESQLDRLIENIRRKQDLDKKVKSGLEDLFRAVN